MSGDVEITSFGYLHGDPPSSDAVIDVRRYLRDPLIDPGLRQCTGKDDVVIRRVLLTPGCDEIIEGVASLIRGLIQGMYFVDSDQTVTVSIGCSGGRHRSVVLVDQVAEQVRAYRWVVDVEHRDIDEPIVRQAEPPHGYRELFSVAESFPGYEPPWLPSLIKSQWGEDVARIWRGELDDHLGHDDSKIDMAFAVSLARASVSSESIAQAVMCRRLRTGRKVAKVDPAYRTDYLLRVVSQALAVVDRADPDEAKLP